MKFSIITITYNSERYLSETIASVRSQDYPNYEHIIVDGGSTDGTLDIIRKYAENDSRLRWISEPDKGIADAMNKGIALATGDVIAHLHSDDYYPTPDVLSAVAGEFVRHPEAFWVTGGNYIIDEHGNILTKIKARRYSYRKLVRGNFILHASTFIIRKAFAEVGTFNTNRKYAMDYDLWLRLGALGSPVVSDKILSCFRFHKDSLSSSEIEKAFDEELVIRKDFMKRQPIRFIFHYIYYLVKKRRNLNFAKRLLKPDSSQ